MNTLCVTLRLAAKVREFARKDRAREGVDRGGDRERGREGGKEENGNVCPGEDLL